MTEQGPRIQLLYHFCRLQLPRVSLGLAKFESHLSRTMEIYRAKAGERATWEAYLNNLYPLDWFVAVACLEGSAPGWDYLFSAHATRSECLLVDALRARAVRLYPRDEERQETAVTEFWSHLIVSETPGSIPILARYDGQRPLVPWLIRVFQNWHISQLRQRSGIQSLPDDDLALPLPAQQDSRWHEAFCAAARESMQDLAENDWLLLGLRLRYRLSQREVAALLGVHEGTISRQISHLRDRCLDTIAARLQEQGWAGDDLSGLVLNELGSLLMDEPRLSANQLARTLAARGKRLPPGRLDQVED